LYKKKIRTKQKKEENESILFHLSHYLKWIQPNPMHLLIRIYSYVTQWKPDN